MSYDHKSIEPKWQRRWREAGIHAVATDPKLPKFYVLDMFPYPSGAGLHVGHCEGYTATDIITRYKRMRGFNVLHPFGWDAFGLPAENYALKTGVHPRLTTEKAIAEFRRQLDTLGFAYDWDREINTTDPQFYRWTQWIFLKLYERGLAYEAMAPINWCPACATGLANEEVTAGKCQRCGTQVERKAVRQWMLRITRYADRLLDDLEEVDWPESTVQMQRNWIGRSVGADVVFAVVDGADQGKQINVFTTRPDTLFGATYVAISPEHPLATSIATEDRRAQVAEYIETARSKSALERMSLSQHKTGVFTGAFARNPASGESVPIWIADYVLASYGTGAVMGVPAHDERDYDFAKTNELPIRVVVQAATPSSNSPDACVLYTGEGVCINSQLLDGLPTAQAKQRMAAYLEQMGLGKAAIRYRLRDWVFSRQRYWGEPIPIVHCEKCGAVPVGESDLPVRLPDVEHYKPSGDGNSPLANHSEWLQTKCARCGSNARRETNTMPQWAGSCWYYLRYLDSHNEDSHNGSSNAQSPWSMQAERRWMNVDLYVGGAEHATLHLLYARFWHKVLFDLGLVSTKEPFRKLRHQGIVLAPSYRDSRGRYYSTEEMGFSDGVPRAVETGEPLIAEIEKMAKSKMNGINPDAVVEQYGADVLRLYEMFMGDFDLPKPWDPRAIEGCSRFLRRIWRLVESFSPDVDSQRDLHMRRQHTTIKKVQDDIEQMKFNTAIAALMSYVNALVQQGARLADLDALIKLLAPFAPHMADEAWHRLYGEDAKLLLQESWPAFDPALAQAERLVMTVQIDGKTRGTIEVARDREDDEIRKLALAHQNVLEHSRGKQIVKVIVVRNRIVNIVTSQAVRPSDPD